MASLTASSRLWAITGIVTALVITGTSIWNTYRSASAAPRDKSTEISVSESRTAPVPRCATVAGRAPVIAGRDVWVAAGLKSGGFSLASATQRDDGTWSTQITIGEENERGSTYPMYAFFLPETESQFVAGIRAYSSDGQAGYFYAKAIPPGAEHQTSWLATRDATSTTRCGQGPATTPEPRS